MPQRCGLPFKLSLLHLKFWPTWLGLGLMAIISLFPTSVRHALGRKIGTYIYKKNKKRKHVVNTNLEIVLSEMHEDERKATALKHFQWYGCALVDYSMIFFAGKKRLVSMSEIVGKEHLETAISENKPVILLVVHSVMLEFALPQLSYYYETFGSYKTSKNPVLDWMIARSRCRHLRLVVSREEGLRKLLKAMSPKRIMLFAPDEDLGRENAVFAPFYSKEKSTLTTTARLTKMGKAITLPSFTYYDDNKKKYITKIGPALEKYPSKDGVADAINMNQALETLISERPEQYMWFMKWYKTRPEGEKDIY